MAPCTDLRGPAGFYGLASSAVEGTVTEPMRPELTSTTTTRSDPASTLDSRRSSNVRPSFRAF